MLALKRVYDKSAPEDGVRFLVERLWPRGIRKIDLRFDAWLQDVAPSAALRQWFSHDPEKWIEFKLRYFAELSSHPEACEPIFSAARHGRVTLLYSSHDAEHNNAVALREYVNARMGKQKKIDLTGTASATSPETAHTRNTTGKEFRNFIASHWEIRENAIPG